MTETELWKVIKGTHPKAKISNHGRILYMSSDNVWKEPYMRQKTNGYVYVALHMNGKRKEYKLHRLVAEYFIQNPFNHPEVNHIDENKLNNTASNLQWCDHSTNVRHSRRSMGEGQKRASHIKKIMLLQRSDGKLFDTIARASFITGIHRSTIQNCLQGYIKTAGGYGWRWMSRNAISGIKQIEIEFN